MNDYGKLQPQAVQIEKELLGAILFESKCFDLIQENFTPELFYMDANQKIANSIISLKNKSLPVEVTTVMKDLKQKGELDFIGGTFTLVQLQDQRGKAHSVDYYVRLLQQEATKRKAIEIGSTLVEESFKDTSDVFDIIDLAEKGITELTKKIITSKIVDSGQLAIDTDKKNELIRKSGGVTGISTGFVDFDKKIGGWQKTDLVILAARPGMGKTALATQLLSSPAISAHRIPTAIFSLEMSNEQLYMRMKSQQSGIELYKFTKYGLNEVEKSSCDTLCKGLYHAPIYFDDTGGITIFDLKNKARKLKREKGIELLIIDYLQLIRVKDHKGNREQEISTISRELKALAKELEISIICLSQLSREVEKRGGTQKRPILSDLRESGAIEQDADVVIFIYRPEYYGITEEDGMSVVGKAAIIIAKNRNGTTDDVILTWEGQLTRFRDNSPFTFDEALKPLEPNEAF